MDYRYIIGTREVLLGLERCYWDSRGVIGTLEVIQGVFGN